MALDETRSLPLLDIFEGGLRPIFLMFLEYLQPDEAILEIPR